MGKEPGTEEGGGGGTGKREMGVGGGQDREVVVMKKRPTQEAFVVGAVTKLPSLSKPETVCQAGKEMPGAVCCDSKNALPLPSLPPSPHPPPLSPLPVLPHCHVYDRGVVMVGDAGWQGASTCHTVDARTRLVSLRSCLRCHARAQPPDSSLSAPIIVYVGLSRGRMFITPSADSVHFPL